MVQCEVEGTCVGIGLERRRDLVEYRKDDGVQMWESAGSGNAIT